MRLYSSFLNWTPVVSQVIQKTSIEASLVESMTRWRRDLHANPELAFAEFRTSDMVATALSGMGIDVHRGLGKTGLVGTLVNGEGPSIGLRADMDALPVVELGEVQHRSVNAGRMHACGHDGHTAMLLGAAQHLSKHRSFNGTVHFIFQPAEENEGGGRAMVEDGLFTRFPCEAVYGMHNWPGLPAGQFAINHGPMMAALDTFEVTVTGRGSHAAMPDQGVDPFISVANIVLALQTIPSRILSALDSAVVSVTQIHGGDAMNVIPDSVVIRGTARCFSEDVRARIEASLRSICQDVATAHRANAVVTYRNGYPPTVNFPAQADHAIQAARALVGADNVRLGVRPSMASEDFAFMLQARPGAYIWLGADGPLASKPLHNPRYDFNDSTLALGAAYWVSLVQTQLI
jgi:amidohydrolase